MHRLYRNVTSSDFSRHHYPFPRYCWKVMRRGRGAAILPRPSRDSVASLPRCNEKGTDKITCTAVEVDRELFFHGIKKWLPVFSCWTANDIYPRGMLYTYACFCATYLERSFGDGSRGTWFSFSLALASRRPDARGPPRLRAQVQRSFVFWKKENFPA